MQALSAEVKEHDRLEKARKDFPITDGGELQGELKMHERPRKTARSRIPAATTSHQPPPPKQSTAVPWNQLGQLVGHMLPERFAADKCADSPDSTIAGEVPRKHLWIVSFYRHVDAQGAISFKAASRLHTSSAAHLIAEYLHRCTQQVQTCTTSGSRSGQLTAPSGSHSVKTSKYQAM